MKTTEPEGKIRDGVADTRVTGTKDEDIDTYKIVTWILAIS